VNAGGNKKASRSERLFGESVWTAYPLATPEGALSRSRESRWLVFIGVFLTTRAGSGQRFSLIPLFCHSCADKNLLSVIPGREAGPESLRVTKKILRSLSGSQNDVRVCCHCEERSDAAIKIGRWIASRCSQ
jgi:hypothetical protein